MKRIIPEILTKKILHLFFENKKKTFNLKQIKFFIGNFLDIKLLKPILYEFVKYGYLSNSGKDKFRFKVNRNILKSKDIMPDREQVTKQVDDIVKSIFDKDKLMNIGIESTLSKVGEDEYEIKVL